MASQLDSGPPVFARRTGTVAFLFTDIGGSTVRWENASAADRHRRKPPTYLSYDTAPVES
ncbi:MAG: hypothetical protein ABSF08_03575 [Candidatus Cybelea sp.]|jgi:hypothetical protein